MTEASCKALYDEHNLEGCFADLSLVDHPIVHIIEEIHKMSSRTHYSVHFWSG